jgi:predicted alpha/beta-hydrolase family hydrolase
MADRGMVALAQTLGGAGFDVVRFNFPYREKRAKLPDPMPVLKECIASTATRVRGDRKLIIGGRSMGGRAASMLAADGFECDGLLLLAYPLHPAGHPAKLRDAHLAQIRVPVLCFNGTRDALCDRKLMDPIVSSLEHCQMHWLEGADHSFHVLKSSGRSDDLVMEEVGASAQRWLASL